MSEHQHYEFLALDRRLTPAQQSALRGISSRAEISATRFVNQYNFGDLRGDPIRILVEYFDVFFYFANWGANRIAFRLPAASFDLEAVEPYCNEYLSVTRHGSSVVVDFQLADENHRDEEWWENERKLADLLPIREMLLRGDLRSLFIAWLGGVLYREDLGLDEDDDEEERASDPPVPPGLSELPPALEALAEFLDIDLAEVEAAGEAVPASAEGEPAWEDLAAWVHQLPAEEKDDWLMRLVEGEEPNLSAVFYRALLQRNASLSPAAAGSLPPRAEVKQRTEQIRARREAEEEARRQAARDQQFAALASQEPEMWARVLTSLEQKAGNNYKHAVAVLVQLRDLYRWKGASEEFARRFQPIRQKYGHSPALRRRMQEAGLG